jgi:hypothetical protein
MMAPCLLPTWSSSPVGQAAKPSAVSSAVQGWSEPSSAAPASASAAALLSLPPEVSSG